MFLFFSLLFYFFLEEILSVFLVHQPNITPLSIDFVFLFRRWIVVEFSSSSFWLCVFASVVVVFFVVIDVVLVDVFSVVAGRLVKWASCSTNFFSFLHMHTLSLSILLSLSISSRQIVKPLNLLAHCLKYNGKMARHGNSITFVLISFFFLFLFHRGISFRVTKFSN